MSLKYLIRLRITILFTAVIIIPAGINAQEDEITEIDSDFFYFYGIDDHIDVVVDVASTFKEEELVIGSTVSKIVPNQWKRLGARNFYEVLNNEMSIVTYPSVIGTRIISIRGYTSISSNEGIAFLIDGIPLNEYSSGNPLIVTPTWELGTLSNIEVIKGPGSAIYGSDAFHGVISMKTFESDKDHYSIEGAGAYPLYGDMSFRLSHGFSDNFVRIDMSAGASYQGDQYLEYQWEAPSSFMSYPQGEGKGERDMNYHCTTGVLKIKLNPDGKMKLKLGGYINLGKYEEFPTAYSTLNIFDPTSNEKISLREHDHSFAEPLLIMGTGKLSYETESKISIEASGYYWYYDTAFETVVLPTGDLYMNELNSYRGSAKVIIKQNDNPINLQWLIAYSYTNMGITLATAEVPIVSIKYKEPFDGLSEDINSLYCQFKWDIYSIYLLAGARYDYYSSFGGQLTPRVGIIFLPSEKTSIKALYGRAFTAPSANAQVGKRNLSLGDKNIVPEIIDNYEFAFIHKEENWKVSLTPFYSIWKNAIIMESAPSLYPDYLFKYVNKGNNEAYGGELNIFYSIKPIAIDFGFSYIKSKAINAEDMSNPLIKTDQEYDTFPVYSFNGGLYYFLESFDITFYLNNRIYLNRRETSYNEKPNPKKLSEYYRLDFNINWIKTDILEAYLDIRNILNRENRVPSVWGADNGYVEPGISIMLRAGYKI